MTKKKDPKDLQKVGRKESITPELEDRLIAMFKMGLSDAEACSGIGISTTAMYDYRNRHPEFAERKAYAKNHLLAEAKRVLYEGLGSNDEKIRLDTSKWILERRDKEEYSIRKEITGKDGESLTHKVFVTADDVDLVETHIDEFIAN